MNNRTNHSNPKRVIFVVFAVLVILINGSHAFWNLAFTSTFILVIFKFLLTLVWIYVLVSEQKLFEINVYLKRFVSLTLFVLLLGIPKYNVNLQPFLGAYKLIDVQMYDNATKENYKHKVHLETLEKTSGMYDSTLKTEKVIPFLYLFEWRILIHSQLPNNSTVQVNQLE